MLPPKTLTNMLKNSSFSYKKLKKDPSIYKDDEEERQQEQLQQQHSHVVQFQVQRSRRFRLRRRWRFRVPRLRKIFKRRRKFLWASWAKIVRRLKESQTHFGELFAGNYLFLQVTPESLRVGSKAHLPPPTYLNYMPASARAGW